MMAIYCVDVTINHCAKILTLWNNEMIFSTTKGLIILIAPCLENIYWIGNNDWVLHRKLRFVSHATTAKVLQI